MTFDASSFLATAPTKPGVYIMRDHGDGILYVGKAKNLKNRLSSYFRTKQLSPKTQVLVTHIAAIEVTITETENEALLLESNLIKKFKPRYNVSLIDDKSYPYIHLSSHAFPRLSFYRGSRKLKGRLFGPFPSSTAVRETLDLMKKIFKVRQCDDAFFSHRTRPCLQFQIKRCSAPCTNEINHEDYGQDVRAATLFLEGNSQVLVAQLADKMQQLSDQLQFEAAAKVRDQIQSLRLIQAKNIIEEGIESLDAIAHYRAADLNVVEVLSIRDGRVLGARAFFPKVPKDTEPKEVVASFISQYYGAHRPPPTQILLNQPLEQEDALWLTDWLTELLKKKVQLQFNVRQQKARWLLMAENNAKQALETKLAGKASIAFRLQSLAQLLTGPLPQRIECFDISHSFGERTVASNVVFTQAGFSKQCYRRFNIEGITGGDDYAAMRQALTRRFQKKEADHYPDLLLIDGGKNQLQIAIDVLASLEIKGIRMIGVAKGEGRRAGLETLWEAGNPTPLAIDSTSAAFHLITQIRDEAHRFAIEGHRNRRDQARKHSVLENIPGIGAQRRAKLLAHFGGLESLKKASIEDIAKVPSIHLKLANDIFVALHN